MTISTKHTSLCTHTHKCKCKKHDSAKFIILENTVQLYENFKSEVEKSILVAFPSYVTFNHLFNLSHKLRFNYKLRHKCEVEIWDHTASIFSSSQ